MSERSQDLMRMSRLAGQLEEALRGGRPCYRVECAWCQVFLYLTPAPSWEEDGGVSHGLCDECDARMAREEP